MSHKNPFLGLGLNSWSQGFARLIANLFGSVAFDGDGDFLTIEDNTDLEFGSGDFTIEAWVYLNSSKNQTIISKWSNSAIAFSEFIFRITSSNEVQLNLSTGSAISQFTTNLSPSLSLNTWHHVAVARYGDKLRMFFDGNLEIDHGVGVTIPATDSDTLVGRTVNQEDFDGNISNLRVIKGKALYKSSFTPPTEQLQSDFRTLNSVAFDGDDGLSIPFDSSLNILDSDFTFETFFKYFGTATDVANNGPYTVFHLGNNSNLILRLVSSGGNVVFEVRYLAVSSNNYFTTTPITSSTWHHVALVKESSTLKVFFNGTEIDSRFAGTFNSYSGPFRIGYTGSNTLYFDGRLSNLRFVIGTAVYTGAFTAPTEPLENITNTVILACNSSSPTAEETGKTITVIGDPSATTDVPFVTSSSLLCCQSKEDASQEATGKEILIGGDAEASGLNPF